MKTVLFCLLLTLSSIATAKEGLTVDVKLSPAGSFQIVSEKINGMIVKVDGTYLAKDIKIPVKPFSTDIDLRDKHVKEKLESKTFPYIQVKAAKASSGKGKARLVVRKVEKLIDFDYSELPGNQLKINFKLSLKDFKFEDFSYMGITVEDEIKVEAQLGYTERAATKPTKAKK
ncbi:MAG: YceI family protein [Bacteriovoracaceae bacterium]|nr:YceI family protein [Bacteriovoracaceae bacterium]